MRPLHLLLLCAALVWLAPIIGGGAEAHQFVIERLDHCEQWFCDFQRHYLPQAERLADGKTEIVKGYFYPPFLGLLLSPFTQPTLSMMIWFGVQLLSIALLLMAGRKVGASWSVICVLVLSSTAVWHNWKWGQVSVLINALAVLGLLYPARLGGCLVGLAAALKGYPAIWLVIAGLNRQWWRCAWGLGVGAGIGLMLPAALIGVAPVAKFIDNMRLSGAHISSLAPSLGGQALEPSLHRWLVEGSMAVNGQYHTEGLVMSLSPAIAQLLSVAFLGLALLWFSRKWSHTCVLHRTLWLLLWLVLVLPPGWVHYYSLLPVIQAYLWLFPKLRWPLLGVLLVERFPLLLLSFVPDIYFSWAMWGGATLCGLLTLYLLSLVLTEQRNKVEVVA